MTRGFEKVSKENRDDHSTIMPKRSTKNSAGYDFHNNTDRDLTIQPMQTVKWMTNIKAYMLPDEYLEMVPRSSIGIKKHLMLCNTIGIIDADYYNNPGNEGNIGIFLYNYGTEPITIKAGEKVCQGIFKKYLISDNCNSDDERIGGVGSTNV